MISLYTVKQFVTAPKTLFFLTFVTLLVPNVALCLTEHLSVLASMVNVLLPLGVYWLLMTLSGKPGEIAWVLFPLIFLAAFQRVVL